MIQDIYPHVFDNSYKICRPESGSKILYYSDGEVLVSALEPLDFLTYDRLSPGDSLEGNLTYLFSIDGTLFFLAKKLSDKSLAECVFIKAMQLRQAQPGHMAFAGITGMQLYRWYDANRYCGKCRQPLEHAEKERMLKCPECGSMTFPKLCPAVIVGLVNGERLLLSRYAPGHSAYRKYSLIAGFAEIGESIEDTVRREVYEEVGLRVKDIKYFRSQPWSFSDSLLLGFFAHIDGSERITLDLSELCEAGWFAPDEIDARPDDISLTGQMMYCFKQGELPW